MKTKPYLDILLNKQKGRVDELGKQMLAKRVVVECHKECCLQRGYEYGVGTVDECLQEISGLTRHEKKMHLLGKVNFKANNIMSSSGLIIIFNLRCEPTLKAFLRRAMLKLIGLLASPQAKSLMFARHAFAQLIVAATHMWMSSAPP